MNKHNFFQVCTVKMSLTTTSVDRLLSIEREDRRRYIGWEVMHFKLVQKMAASRVVRCKKDIDMMEKLNNGAFARKFSGVYEQTLLDLQTAEKQLDECEERLVSLDAMMNYLSHPSSECDGFSWRRLATLEFNRLWILNSIKNIAGCIDRISAHIESTKLKILHLSGISSENFTVVSYQNQLADLCEEKDRLGRVLSREMDRLEKVLLSMEKTLCVVEGGIVVHSDE